MSVIRMKLHPTVLSFFRSLNEIEYSGNIKFDTLRPFGNDIVKDPYVYKNCRRYYERPEKIVWLSDNGYKHDIVNIVRIDGDEDPKITTKFKIYKEHFVCQECEQRYSFTGSIELPVENCDRRLTKPFTKMLYITYWYLLIDDRFVFRVAFRKNAINEKIRCNIECETQSITREKFVDYFQLLKSHYIYQNENMGTIEPLCADRLPSAPSISVISQEQANTVDGQFVDESLGGTNVVCKTKNLHDLQFFFVIFTFFFRFTDAVVEFVERETAVTLKWFA